MERIELLELYVSAALGIKVHVEPLPSAKNLPFFYRESGQVFLEKTI